jgi:hypothetical protein
MLVLDTLIQHLPPRPFVWVRDEPTEEDLDWILREANDTSPFDTLHLRKEMLEEVRAGRAVLEGRRGPWAKVFVLCAPEHHHSIPWNLFGAIFAAFGKPAKPCPGGAWRVVLFANPRPRQMPNPGNPVEPQHLNGGYAYPSDPRSIVIYRLEECARVLAHELLHACGSDSLSDDTVMREVKTETWAELFLTAIRARGSVRRGRALWAIQAQWIADQEFLLHKLYGVRGPEDYAWRYTVGRRAVLEGLGIGLPEVSSMEDAQMHIQGRLRLTAPALSDAGC